MSTRFPAEYLPDYERIGQFRGLQKAIANKYSMQMMRCPVHLSVGQEYWLAPIQRLRRAGDRCFSSHRSHSMYMALGGDTERLIAELHGHPNGSLGGRGGSMHLKDLSVGLEQSVPIVGSSLALALGSALAAKHQGQEILTISYFGDGACEEGVLHESLNMSKVLRLPILFICENNLYSCNTRWENRQSSSKMSRFASAHGLPSESIEPNMGYGEIVRKLTKAFQLGKEEPFFLEVYSYRLYEHCGHSIDSGNGDRTQAEYDEYSSNDSFTLLCKDYPSVLDEYEKSLRSCEEIILRYTSFNNQLLSA